MSKQAASPRAIVVGAGIIGICSALALRRVGYEVLVVDRGEPAMEASRGNASCIAASEIIPMAVPGLLWKVPRWLLDPLGPLAVRPARLPRLVPWLLRFLRDGATWEQVRCKTAAMAPLLESAWTLWPDLLRESGLSDHLQARGWITVYETDAAFTADRRTLDLRAEHGVPVQKLTAADLHDLEPDLAPVFRHAVLFPRTAHLSNPYRVTRALFDRLTAEGAVSFRQDTVTDASGEGVTLADGTHLPADVVVIAAGAWSDALCRRRGIRVLLEAERGYNTTLPHPGVTLNRPIMSGEYKFVLSPLADGLRIGGAAEFAGLEAPPNYARCDALLTIARRYLPQMDTSDGERWMGQRPSTPDSLPVIGRAPNDRRLLLAFGHGHLGLTGAPPTAAAIAALARDEEPPFDIRPFSVSRFE